MKIATFNVNSIRARIVSLCKWIKNNNPDLLFLQEIKCEQDNFPFFEFESLGYNVAVLGQKSYNGVAILSKSNFEITERNLPNFNDDAMRYLEILVTIKNQTFYAASVYVPNGCAPDANIQKEKLNYKLEWFNTLYCHLKQLQKRNLPIIIGGDFNIMMREIDVFDSSLFQNSPLYIKPVQDKIITLQNLGLYDAFRILHPNDEGFTFWDYTANSFVTNSGLRIDYIFISAKFAENLKTCYPDKTLRMTDKPSDHTVLVAEIEDNDD
ncbi:MAG: exodeoxyribonuclease III [Alphaproteobacteria bacterium]|nr:exodeoxyribonuclease III [Alphaproteobacteria bacterium]